MSYSSWSVVFGEQPSAAKWNILGTNDAFFNTQIGSGFSSTSSTVWWEELGRYTASGAVDNMSVSGMTARKYLQVHLYTVTSGATAVQVQFNNDTGSNYSYRYSANNGADTTSTSQDRIVLAASETSNRIAEFDVINVAAQEKLLIGHTVSFGTAGAGNAPTRWDDSGKWANTAAQITRIDIVNDAAGDFASGSQVVVLGHD